MQAFDDIERSREASEGLAYEAYRASFLPESTCACGHDRSEHDWEGTCEMRRCPCPGFHLPGDEPPGAATDPRPDPSEHPEYWTE